MLKNKKILVTGGAGFLGSYVVDNLCQQNNVVVPRSSEFDLRNIFSAEKLIRFGNFDIILHLAAKVGGIGFNQKNPVQLCQDNLLMGINVLDCAARYNVPKVVVVGTACSYPKFVALPFKEEEIWNGYPEETNAPYGIAKKTILTLGQAYHDEGHNFISLIPANLYGPRDNFNLFSSHVIPALIRKFSEAKKKDLSSVSLWGDGSPTREFLYVEDAAEGILLATEKYNEREPINLAANSEISIADLAFKIKDLIDYQGEIFWDLSKPNGQPRRRLDNEKAKIKFGFEAQTDLNSGLRKTISFFEQKML